jgi:hypothetical protein
MAEGSGVAAAQRRKSARIRLDVPARYMLANGRVYEGSITNASLAGLALVATERGEIGEHVTIDVDGIGRLDGKVARHSKAGFAVNLVGDRSAVVATIARLVEHLHRQNE